MDDLDPVEKVNCSADLDEVDPNFPFWKMFFGLDLLLDSVFNCSVHFGESKTKSMILVFEKPSHS